MPKIVTVEWLVKQGACPGQRRLFAKHYPEGLTLAPGALVAAEQVGLDVGWAVLFLSVPHKKTFWKFYDQVIALHQKDILKAYNQVIAPQLEKYLDDLIRAN